MVGGPTAGGGCERKERGKKGDIARTRGRTVFLRWGVISEYNVMLVSSSSIPSNENTCGAVARGGRIKTSRRRYELKESPGYT